MFTCPSPCRPFPLAQSIASDECSSFRYPLLYHVRPRRLGATERLSITLNTTVKRLNREKFFTDSTKRPMAITAAVVMATAQRAELAPKAQHIKELVTTQVKLS